MPNVKDLACEYRTTLEPCLDEPPSPLSASDNDCVSGLGRVMMSGSTLLNNLGLGVDPARPEGSERLYRSMENLQWVTEPSLYSFGGQYRSVDSELIFRCTTSTSSRNHWYGVPLRMPVRKDMQLLPQWLLPPADERVDIRRGLKEKLRSQTTRLIEPSRPLRPPGVTSALPGVLWETCDRQLAPPCPSHSHAIPSVCRITSPQEIKQEVIRRLQLRRQVSTPDLSLPRPEEQAKPLAQATSTQSILDSTLERKRPPAGRLHIPTFEEFKRMRQKEVAAKEGRGPGTEGRNHLIETRDLLCRSTEHVNDQCFHGNPTEAPSSSDTPVCTSPTPHPLQQGPVQATPTQTCLRPEASSSSTCCPGLLLDTTELSAYGAKITRIRDGLLGSALGLIKKSCSAEIAAEDHIRMSHDRYEDSGGDDIRGTRPPVVAMATEAHSQEAEEGECADCHSPTLGCRRSSSDAAYQPAESARAQRECRLRPHYSDPMPANATKRKQLEMKLAAAARLHVPESHIGRETTAVGVARVEHQRWSNLSNTSSLSVDSGVVGLSDEQDKEAEPRRCTRGAEVERTDSGIGSGLARSWRRPCASIQAWDTQRPCIDCGHRDPARRDAVCEKCCKLRTERKEALLEFLNTECSYGEDLRIIREEFYCPMQAAGLLTAEQLNVVFGNVQELIDVNDSFTQHLQESITQAFNKGDEDLLTVCIGEIFLEFVNMLPAFQTYCLQQSASVNMLNSLEKEKELLRIFLDVSQNDNTALRRMNLRSFLMAPLQRVTKYPLLLSRISKSTSGQHPDHGRLREAKSRVESHLEHINRKTKQQECGGGGAGAPWSLRSFRRESRRSREAADVEMREVSLRTVGWARESTQFVMEGPLQLSQPTDGSWVRKGSRSLKFQNVQSVLMVHGREPVQDGVLVLIKDKSGGKFAVLREPIRLGNCVVSADPDCEDAFELLDIPREAFVFRAADRSRTQQWFHQIRRYSHDLGPWRKRRNALPNIMISTGPNKS